MSQTFNVYCDESCHLENDHQNVMVLGAVWCPLEKAHEIGVRIGELKSQHGLSSQFEIKWAKVSPAKQDFYLSLVNYFFDNDDLHFRALVVPDKSKLKHETFGQSHDEWYYKMYFDLLKVIFDPKAQYRIYLDIKDTRSAEKVAKLHDVLCNNLYDFSRQVIERVQTVRSHEVRILQLSDLLIGAISYVNRSLSTSVAKQMLISKIQEKSHYSLTKTTLLRENKLNIFRWHAAEKEA
jgi:hypothetical protein